MIKRLWCWVVGHDWVNSYSHERFTIRRECWRCDLIEDEFPTAKPQEFINNTTADNFIPEIWGPVLRREEQAWREIAAMPDVDEVPATLDWREYFHLPLYPDSWYTKEGDSCG